MPNDKPTPPPGQETNIGHVGIRLAQLSDALFGEFGAIQLINDHLRDLGEKLDDNLQQAKAARRAAERAANQAVELTARVEGLERSRKETLSRIELLQLQLEKPDGRE